MIKRSDSSPMTWNRLRVNWNRLYIYIYINKCVCEISMVYIYIYLWRMKQDYWGETKKVLGFSLDRYWSDTCRLRRLLAWRSLSGASTWTSRDFVRLKRANSELPLCNRWPGSPWYLLSPNRPVVSLRRCRFPHRTDGRTHGRKQRKHKQMTKTKDVHFWLTMHFLMSSPARFVVVVVVIAAAAVAVVSWECGKQQQNCKSDDDTFTCDAAIRSTSSLESEESHFVVDWWSDGDRLTLLATNWQTT